MVLRVLQFVAKHTTHASVSNTYAPRCKQQATHCVAKCTSISAQAANVVLRMGRNARLAATLLHEVDPVTALECQRACLQQTQRDEARILRLARKRKRYADEQLLLGLSVGHWSVAAHVFVLPGHSESVTDQYCSMHTIAEPGNSGAPQRVTGKRIKGLLAKVGALTLDALRSHLPNPGNREPALRACIFLSELQVFRWVTNANEKGVFPWTRDVAIQLTTQMTAMQSSHPAIAECIRTLLARNAAGESTMRNWGKRFRRKWGLKYGRGITLTPLRPSEIERKASIS